MRGLLAPSPPNCPQLQVRWPPGGREDEPRREGARAGGGCNKGWMSMHVGTVWGGGGWHKALVLALLACGGAC